MCISEILSQDKKGIRVGSLLLTTILAEIIRCSTPLQTSCKRTELVNVQII